MDSSCILYNCRILYVLVVYCESIIKVVPSHKKVVPHIHSVLYSFCTLYNITGNVVFFSFSLYNVNDILLHVRIYVVAMEIDTVAMETRRLPRPSL